MNAHLISMEIWVAALGLLLLLGDLWVPARHKRALAWLAAAALGFFLALSYAFEASLPAVKAADGFVAVRPDFPLYAFGKSYVLDGLALFFKRFFLAAAILVLVLAARERDATEGGIAEYCSLTLFALAGMMFAASASHFATLFVSIELITVTFYVLVSFQRRRLQSLEAGVKYLILGALSSAFMIYGIALVFGASGTMSFSELAAAPAGLTSQPLFVTGFLMVLAGLAFKIAAVPFQFWAPDVYQGAPTPTTAFLAVGSKAAGFALLLRLLQSALPQPLPHHPTLLIALAGVTVLYGNLCALPQTNLKRLLGYSSIANAGYLLAGVAVMSRAGSAAVLYYLGGYLFTLMAAFCVIAVVLRQTGAEDIKSLAGLGRRSPFLAAAMTLAMVSLAGVPPLAGFFGKFLLIKSVIEQGAAHAAFYWLAGIVLVGVVISFYYYFGVVRSIYWGEEPEDLSPVQSSWADRFVLAVCIAGMLYLGVLPSWLLGVAAEAVKSLRLS